MLGFGPFQLHAATRRLSRDGQPVALRSSAFEILLALLEHPGEVVPKRLLCERAWPGRDVDENNLQVEVSALRKLIGAGAIVTASGRGYQFAGDVVRHDEGTTPLLGRERDLDALRALVAPGELVSIVGEGGIGKSRLARALAQGVAGACVLHLDDATRDAELLHALGAALSIDAATRRGLVAALRRDTRWLVFDGCDGVLQPLAELAAALALECPAVALLATSRETLRVPLERVYRLGPLSPAAALDRLAQGIPGALADADMPAAQALCDRLDGNPLAIGLAARRIAERGLATALRELDGCLDWQAPEDTGTPERQRSLRASFDASCRGLAPNERRLLAALATLDQPFGFDELHALRLTPPLDRWEQLEALGRLADKSLLGVDDAQDHVFRMSGVTQLYARSIFS